MRGGGRKLGRSWSRDTLNFAWATNLSGTDSAVPKVKSSQHELETNQDSRLPWLPHWLPWIPSNHIGYTMVVPTHLISLMTMKAKWDPRLQGCNQPLNRVFRAVLCAVALDLLWRGWGGVSKTFSCHVLAFYPALKNPFLTKQQFLKH